MWFAFEIQEKQGLKLAGSVRSGSDVVVLQLRNMSIGDDLNIWQSTLGSGRIGQSVRMTHLICEKYVSDTKIS